MSFVSKARGAVNLLVVGGLAALFLSSVNLPFLFLDLLGGTLKLGWRLIVFAIGFRIFLMAMGKLFRAGLGIMMAGGPIRAFKAFFFGTAATIFSTLSAFLARRGLLSTLADALGSLARGCDDRCPPPSPFDGGLAGFGGGGGMGNANPFAGGASPFGDIGGLGGGANLFGGGGANPFGDLGDLGGLGGGANPFGDGSAFGDALLGDALLGGAAPSTGGSPPIQPPTPYVSSSSAPGVTIKVRTPGNSAGRAGGDSSAAGQGGPKALSSDDALARYAAERPSGSGAEAADAAAAGSEDDPEVSQ